MDSQRYSYRTIAEGSDTLLLGQCPAINNFGTVSFPASEFDPATENLEDKILRGAGGPLTTIADESDGFTSISGNPTINDLGALTEIARAGSAQRFDSFTADVSLNNLGRVAFTAFDDDFTREAVFTGRGGPLTEVANTLGEYSSFGFRGPSIGDLGRVTFQADLDDFTSSGVFPVADAVIRTGDTVAGKTVQSVFACREMLNARGQVAVKVTFDDFSEAIVRATPRP